MQPPEPAAGQDVQLEPLEVAEQLARVERKPPLYRAFRGTLYVVYLVVAAWLTVAVAVAAGRGVWGADGQAIKRAQDQARPVTVVEPPTE